MKRPQILEELQIALEGFSLPEDLNPQTQLGIVRNHDQFCYSFRRDLGKRHNSTDRISLAIRQYERGTAKPLQGIEGELTKEEITFQIRTILDDMPYKLILPPPHPITQIIITSKYRIEELIQNTLSSSE